MTCLPYLATRKGLDQVRQQACAMIAGPATQRKAVMCEGLSMPQSFIGWAPASSHQRTERTMVTNVTAKQAFKVCLPQNSSPFCYCQLLPEGLSENNASKGIRLLLLQPSTQYFSG